MRIAHDILAMLPADAIGHSSVPAGRRVAEAAVLVALAVAGIAAAFRAALADAKAQRYASSTGLPLTYGDSPEK